MARVKICGLTNPGDAIKAYESGADFLGFIFFEGSPRRLDAEKARLIIRELPAGAIKVGLFLNQGMDTVRRAAEKCGLDLLQLHGDESPAYAGGLKKDFRIIKSFRVKDASSLEKAQGGYEEADYYLFDTYVKGLAGGTGKTFDWDILSGRAFKRPIFLAGGLTPDNVREAIGRVSPYAVDVASGVEKSPGIKDHKLLKEFIKNAKEK
jgi:phosphoribosylanthranilate isomerase